MLLVWSGHMGGPRRCGHVRDIQDESPGRHKGGEDLNLPFTSVVSLHTNEFGCGVAKFSKELAKRLGVPFVGFDDSAAYGDFPLFSLKWSEMDPPRWHGPQRWGLFWHDMGAKGISHGAEIVYHADPSLGPNGLWCPSLLEPVTPRTVKLFSFGMAHKLQAHYYAKVRQLLDDASIRYHLRVSVGIHEGTSLSDATKHFDALKEIMGPDRVTILGILSDEAVNLELQDADYVLAFFEKGLRANNTTVHAALTAGKVVVTNHDHLTPGYLKASTRDIVTRDEWERTIPYHYSWERLIAKMAEIYAATEDRQSTRL